MYTIVVLAVGATVGAVFSNQLKSGLRQCLEIGARAGREAKTAYEVAKSDAEDLAAESDAAEAEAGAGKRAKARSK